MFKTQKPAMAPSYHDDTSSVRSGRTNNSFTRLFQRSDSSKKFTSNNAIKVAPPGSVNTANLYSSHHSRNGSISSNPITSPVSPTMQFHGNDFAPRGGPLGTLSEEIQSYQEYQQFQAKPQSQELELQYPTPGMEDYRQCLHWLQQTCRPMFMKDLTQHLSVPVPITPANAKKPEQIGGTQDVQVAALKNVQVQIMPLERWGKPQEVLAELQALHSVRRCKQVIQLFGYLPNANVPSGQSPALILQQPSNGSLRQFLSHNFESIQWPDRYKIALDMARGLRFLAEEGIPCTMNSGNILIDADGVAVLTGFGSPGGMIVSAPCQMTTQPSGPSLIVYMAPERIMGLGTYSLEWSLYSLGVLLWELSSGHMPFEEILARAESGPRFAKTMEQLSSAIVKGLREETVPGTPDIYEQLYRMCWSGETESRPPLEVVEETLQMLVVVEPIDMILPGEEMSMPISSVVSERS
ncbi:kinase-like domain-containing protein [Mortierella sp. GBAus27b]|nr:kinase-like domain-containing protein [Mortierella sp. GBAus27b]